MKRQNSDSASDDAMKESPDVERRGHLSPRTPAEELIAGVYTSYLNVSPLGVYDNLLVLGFTPKMAARLELCLQKVFHIDVPAEQLLLCPTIDSLVNLLSERWGGREIVEEIAWTFLQIEKLSDDEVRLQLANEFSSSQGGSEQRDQEQDG